MGNISRYRLIYSILLALALVHYSSFSTAQGNYIQEYQILFQKAQHYYDTDDYVNAFASINKSIEKYAGYPDAYLLRARIYEVNKEYNKALLDYSVYLEWRPDQKQAVFMRGTLLYRLGRFDEAIKDFKVVLQLKSVETNIILFKKPKFESGVTEIMTTEKNSNDYVYHYIALGYLGLEKYRLAIQYLDSAILQNGNEPDLYYHRGLAHEKLGEETFAINDFNKCISINPEHAAAQFQLISLHKGSAPNSKTYLEKLDENISLYPNYPEHYLERAYHLMNNKNYTAALQDLNEAIRISPDDSDALLNRGIVKEHLNDFTGAEQDYLNAIELESNNEKAYLNLGNLLVKQQQYDKSLSYYELAIFYQADYALAYYNRAIAYYYLKQNDKACLDMFKAKSLHYEPAFGSYKRMCE